MVVQRACGQRKRCSGTKIVVRDKALKPDFTACTKHAHGSHPHGSFFSRYINAVTRVLLFKRSTCGLKTKSTTWKIDHITLPNLLRQQPCRLHPVCHNPSSRVCGVSALVMLHVAGTTYGGREVDEITAIHNEPTASRGHSRSSYVAD